MGFRSWLINSHTEDEGKNRSPTLPGGSLFPAEEGMAQAFRRETADGLAGELTLLLTSLVNLAFSCCVFKISIGLSELVV